MDEPLRLFRDSVQNRISMKEVTVGGRHYYVFGDVAYAGDSQTTLQSVGADKFFYTLEAIVQCWNLRDREHNVYVREVSGQSIQVVTLTQKRTLMAYLSGHSDTLSGLVASAPYAVGIPYAQLMEQAHEDLGPEPKRQKLDQTASLDENETLTNFDTTMEVDTSNATEDSFRPLNQDLNAEKIAQLRNKVKKNLKAQVKASATLQEDVFDPYATFPFEDGSGEDVGRALQQVEVPGCSRMQIYSCEGLDVEGVMEYIVDALGKKRHVPANGNARQPLAPNGQPQKRPAVGYSRYDQEVFRQELDTDFHIETDLSFHGANLKNLSQKPALGSQPPKTAAPNPRPGFGPVSAMHPNGRPPKRQSKTPIIVIPASGTALITMYNAEDILQELRFVPSDERKKQKSRRESELLIHRRKENETTVPFRIIEDPRKLRDEEWDRVVAVFVQGPAWQFKGWRFGSHPTEIFARICAFHLKFDEQPLDKNVAQWSVNVLSLSQTKRHLDRAVLHKFWTTLDRYLVKNKPHLRF